MKPFLLPFVPIFSLNHFISIHDQVGYESLQAKQHLSHRLSLNFHFTHFVLIMIKQGLSHNHLSSFKVGYRTQAKRHFLTSSLSHPFPYIGVGGYLLLIKIQRK